MTRSNIVVVTDSSAYIPPEASNGLNIPVIPLWVIWGAERFRDGVDLAPQAFYHRLKKSDLFPTTSQPSAGEFEQFFRQHGATSDTIVGIFVTAKLSGTCANAQAAAARLPDLDIHIIDSRSVSMELGFAVLAAARAAAAGLDLEAVIAAAKRMRERTHLLFTLDTLEFLHRGGRIGKAQWLLGTALNIKPLLHFVDGSIEPLTQVRTKGQAVARMLDIAEERLDGKRMAEAAIIDADSAEEGDDIAEQARHRFAIPRVYRTPVSPAIGVHAGPGTVGIAFYAED